MRRKKKKQSILPGLLGLFTAGFVLLCASAGQGADRLPELPVPEDGGPVLESAQPSETALSSSGGTTSSVTVKERTVAPTGNAKGYVSGGQVYLKNEAGLSVNVSDMLSNPFCPPKTGDGPQVLLIHTHASEAYSNSQGLNGNDRTLNTDYNMIRVGDEIEQTLTAMGVETIHVREICDYPSYNGSYAKSLALIQQQVQANPSIRVVVDVHRDAVIAQDGTRYKMVTEIDGQKAAQLMFVMGSNGSGLSHDNWRDNLNFAVQLQSRLSAQYPTLMRPIILRSSRYNQQVTRGSILLEVGSSGNTLEEALLSARLFGQALGEYLQQG